MVTRINIEIFPVRLGDPPTSTRFSITYDRSPATTRILGEMIGQVVSKLEEIPGSRQDFLNGVRKGITNAKSV